MMFLKEKTTFFSGNVLGVDSFVDSVGDIVAIRLSHNFFANLS